MKEQLKNNATDTAQRMQQNVSNLPLTSIALAGLLGAGVVALYKNIKRNQY